MWYFWTLNISFQAFQFVKLSVVISYYSDGPAFTSDSTSSLRAFYTLSLYTLAFSVLTKICHVKCLFCSGLFNILYCYYMWPTISFSRFGKFPFMVISKVFPMLLVWYSSMPIIQGFGFFMVYKALLCSVCIYFKFIIDLYWMILFFTMSSSFGSFSCMIHSFGKVFYWAFYLTNWVNTILSSWLSFSNYISLLNSTFIC